MLSSENLTSKQGLDLLNSPRYADAVCTQYSTVNNYKKPHQLTLLSFMNFLSTLPQESKSLIHLQKTFESYQNIVFIF